MGVVLCVGIGCESYCMSTSEWMRKSRRMNKFGFWG